MKKSTILSIIKLSVFAIASAKYIPRFNRSKDAIYKSRFRQMLTRPQNNRFSKHNNILSNQAYGVQFKGVILNRKQIFDNSPAVNAKPGLSIQIGNHHIQHSANRIHLRLGINSNKNKLNSANQRQVRNYVNPQKIVRQMSSYPGQSRLTRIVLMRNGKNGGRRNVILKTSVGGAQIHISRNTGNGNGIQYIINTGRSASDRPSAMRASKNHLPSMRNELYRNSGFEQNLIVPTTSPLFGQTTMFPDVSTTEPEDVDLFP